MNQHKAGASTRKQSLHSKFAVWRENHRTVAIQSIHLLLQKPLSSLLTFAVLAIAIALPALLYVGVKNIEAWAGYSNHGLELTAFLNNDINTQKAQKLSDVISQWQGVGEVVSVSPAKALEKLKNNAGLAEVATNLDENPLPTSIVIYLPDTSNVAALAEQVKAKLEGLPEVDLVRADLDWFKKAQAIVDVAQQINLALIAILAGAVVLVIANTIKLAIESRKREILVAKLVGATNSFVRRPFLYLGTFMGVGSAIFALFLVLTSYILLQVNVSPLEAAYGTDIALRGLSLLQCLMIVLVVGALGWLSAWSISHLQIRAIEPR